MSAYQRKTRTFWRLFLDYGQGLEHEIKEYTLPEMREFRKAYRGELPAVPVAHRSRTGTNRAGG